MKYKQDGSEPSCYARYIIHILMQFLQAICLWEIICGDTFHEKREIYYSKMTEFWAAIFYQQCKTHILQKTRFQTDSHQIYLTFFVAL